MILPKTFLTIWTTAMISNCASCRFYKELTSECHRHSPAINKAGFAGWPTTHDMNWCGDWEAAPNQQEPSGEIKALDITARARKILKWNGINDINQLCALTRQDLLSFRNCGQGTVNVIVGGLKDKGLRLKQKYEI